MVAVYGTGNTFMFYGKPFLDLHWYLPKYVCSAQNGFFSVLCLCFPDMLLRYFLNDSEMVPFAPIITGIAFVFTLQNALYFCCKVFIFSNFL